MTLFTFALAEGGLHEKCQCIFWKKLKTFLRGKFKLTPGIYTDEATLGNYFTYSCAVLCCCWQQCCHKMYLLAFLCYQPCHMPSFVLSSISSFRQVHNCIYSTLQHCRLNKCVFPFCQL